MGLIKKWLEGGADDASADATKLLEKQHREVESLFEQIEGADGNEKRALIQELATNLVAHSAIEKEILYKEMLGSDEDGIREAYEEHALVEGLLFKIVNSSVTDQTLDAKLTVLKELIEHHVEEEEKEIFKKAKAELGEERLQELGARMERRFEEVKASDYRGLLEQAVAQTAPKVSRRRTTTKGRAPKAAGAATRKPRKAAASPRASAARDGAKKARGAAKRERISPRGNARFVRRGRSGQFKEVESVGRSLTQDRARKAKTKAKRGQGDRGDRNV
jgi:hypothetical protein